MEEGETGTKAPTSVSLAVRAIWIMIVIRAVVSEANLVESARLQKNPVAFGLAMTILLVAGLGLLAWINLRIAAGRGWAAVVYLIVTAFVMLSVTQSLSLLFGISSVHGVLGIVTIILHCGVALLLLRRDSRAWLFTRNEAASVA